MSTRGRNPRGRPESDDQEEGFSHYSDEKRFDHDTDGIVMYAAELNTAAKKLRKKGKKVEEKQKKTKSKNINKYKSEYTGFYREVIDSFQKLAKILEHQEESQTQQEKSQAFSRKDVKYHSAGPQRRQRERPEMGMVELSEVDGRQRQRKRSENDQLQHLQEQIKQLQIENDKLKSDINRQESEISEQLSRLQDENRRLSAEKKNFQKQIDELQESLDKETIAKTDALGRFEEKYQEAQKLQSSLASQSNSKDDAMRQFQSLSQEIQMLKASLTAEKDAKDDALRRFHSQCQEIQMLEASVTAEKSEKDDALRRCHSLTQDVQMLEASVTTEKAEKDDALRRLYSTSQEIQRLEASVKAEKAAKDDALRRLSAMVSSRLRDNNPNITDLSDQNRPTKLAEKMSELYDNEWTDAYDELEATGGNLNFIKCLFDILMDIFKECKSWSLDNYFEKVLWTIQRSYSAENANDENSDVEVVLSKEMKQQIKEVKKTQARKVLPSIEKMIYDRIPRLEKTPYTLSAMKIYIKKCIEISWLAVVQDPPLALNAGNSDKFDTKLFKEYMKRGPYVEFVVWPALHIEEGGALLCKGVAQGCKERKERKERQPSTAADD